MEEEKDDTQDLKQEEEENLQENQSGSEEKTTSEEEQPLKKEEVEESEEKSDDVDSEGEESSESKVEEMLSDGTPADKDFKIKKSKYDEISEKSKLYDELSPLLAKLNQNPDVIDKIMSSDDEGETVEQRLERLERDQKAKERDELRTTLSDAVNLWPDFHDKWSEIKPMFRQLEKQGLDKREALQRAYFAVNPEAVAQQQRLTAQQLQNQKGKTSSSGGAVNKIVQERGSYTMTAEDKEIARQMGISEEAYQKHAKHISRFSDL